MRFNLILSLLAVSAGLIGSLRAQTPPAPSTARIPIVTVPSLIAAPRTPGPLHAALQPVSRLC